MRMIHKKRRVQFFGLILVGASLVLMCPLETRAQGSASPRSIEVEGTGNASANPDLLVLEGFVSVEDESAKKLPSKYFEIKKKLEETINPMDFPGVKIQFEGSAFKSNSAVSAAAVMMGGGANTEGGYRLSTPIVINVEVDDQDSEKSTLQRLSKLVESAETAGASFSESANPMMGVVLAANGGAASLVKGSLEDTAKLEQEASKAAFADAKAKAEQLAELAGGKLGKVISITESNLADASDPTTAYMKMVTGQQSEAKNGTIKRIKVSRALRVRFELTD